METGIIYGFAELILNILHDPKHVVVPQGLGLGFTEASKGKRQGNECRYHHDYRDCILFAVRA